MVEIAKELAELMNTKAIQNAIGNKDKVYFCEGRNGVNHVVECIPVALYVDDQVSVVGVFIPNGIRVAAVDATLIGVDGFEAQQQVSKRNQIVTTLLGKCWAFSYAEIEANRRARLASQGTAGIVAGGSKGSEEEPN